MREFFVIANKDQDMFLGYDNAGTYASGYPHGASSLRLAHFFSSIEDANKELASESTVRYLNNSLRLINRSPETEWGVYKIEFVFKGR